MVFKSTSHKWCTGNNWFCFVWVWTRSNTNVYPNVPGFNHCQTWLKFMNILVYFAESLTGSTNSRSGQVKKMSKMLMGNFCFAFSLVMSMVSCQNGPTRHAYAWKIGPFWQDTLDVICPVWIHYSSICFMVSWRTLSQLHIYLYT